MQLATVRHGGATSAALVDADVVRTLAFRDVRALLDARAPATPVVDGARSDAGMPIDEVDWAPLVVDPDKIVCVGLNFHDHIREMGREVPTHPTLFAKFSRALIGARDPIRLPAVSRRVDWEAELALVIGRELRDAEPDAAQDAIAGFTVMNDVSMRDFQHRTSQWLQGKTFEGSTPLGPVLVPGDDIGWAADLVVRCFVDGEKVQEISTADIVFGPAATVSYLSRIVTLDPGDVIALGTGAGVGAGRTPPRYLAPGQVLETVIDGIGSLVNECVAAPRA